MNEIIGTDMSIGLLYDFIKESGVSDKLIILLILLMGDKEVLKTKVWNKLSHGYFKKYRAQILLFCGYGGNKYGEERIQVETVYRDLFLACIGGMKRSGIIPEASYARIAKSLDSMFEMGCTKNTILCKLKKEEPDFEELEKLIFSEKKRIKSSCNNKMK